MIASVVGINYECEFLHKVFAPRQLGEFFIYLCHAIEFATLFAFKKIEVKIAVIIGQCCLLSVENATMQFGGVVAVNNLTMEINEGEIVALIGPNGAGKTTIFNLLTKVYQPTRGTILLNHVNINNFSTIQVNQSGIARTFQNIRLFDKLTVLDNVLVGLYREQKTSLGSSVLRLPSFWKSEKIAKQRALELLSIFHMEDLANVKAGSLPYGAQRRLEIVRALATNPSLLLLDEPAAGMNPSETMELMENIVKIRDTFQIAIFLIEHDMNLVMNVCEAIAVVNYGRIIAKGTPEEIRENPAVNITFGYRLLRCLRLARCVLRVFLLCQSV